MANIKYFGHSTVLLEDTSAGSILIDPFIKQNPMTPEHLKSLGKIDHIILTHGHSDHTADALSIAQENNCYVYATYELSQLMEKFGDNKFKTVALNKGGSTKLENSEIKISLTHAQHSNSYDAPDGITYYAGEPCGVVINLGSNVIYHAGDTSYFSDVKFIGKFYNPTLAFIPIGDHFTMGPEEAALFVKKLNVKKVIPIHWGTFPPLTGTPEAFKTACKEYDIDVVKLEPGEILNL